MTQEKQKDDCSPRSRSSSDASKSKEKKDKSFLTKVVIRRLPPTMSEDQFLDQISPVPENDYMYFVKGNKSLGPNAFSRAYINFLNQDEIFIFKEKFDEYVFLDEKGNEYPAIVEYAPFQKIPKRRTRKKDPKCGTIEQDPEYLKFLESLEQPEEVSLPSIDTYIEEIESREKEIKANNGCLKVVTPLIEFLQQRKLEKLKLREERREERKRREVEKKRLRDEEKRRRKVDRERSKDSSLKKDVHFDDEPSQDEAEAKVVKVLRNPVREQDPPSSKDSGVVPKSSSTPGPSKVLARSTASTGGSAARKEWDRPKGSRPTKDTKTTRKITRITPRNIRIIQRSTRTIRRTIRTIPRNIRTTLRSIRTIPRSTRITPRNIRTTPRNIRTTPRRARNTLVPSTSQNKSTGKIPRGLLARCKVMGHPLRSKVPTRSASPRTVLGLRRPTAESRRKTGTERPHPRKRRTPSRKIRVQSGESETRTGRPLRSIDPACAGAQPRNLAARHKTMLQHQASHLEMLARNHLLPKRCLHRMKR
ncbi:unnamed protein product, partial [Ixodes hexagonus]